MPELKGSRIKTSLRIKILMGLITIILIVLMFPEGESIEFEVTEGSIWIHDDLIAQFSFPITKDPAVYNAEIIEAEQRVYPIFLTHKKTKRISIDSLKAYNNFLLATLDSSINNPAVHNLNPTFLTTSSFNVFKSLRRQERSMLLNRQLHMKGLFEISELALARIYENGIINISTKDIKDSIALRTGNVDRIEVAFKFDDINSAARKIERVIEQRALPDEIKKALIEYLNHFIIPDIVYSDELTKEEILHAKENVSKYSGIVNENERIIAKHDRITREARLKIESYKLAKGEKIGEEGLFLQFIGKLLHIAFLISLFTIYLYHFRKKIFYSNDKLLLISINFLFLALLTYLTNQLEVKASIQYLIILPASSMLITIIFDSRVGFYSTVIMALVIAALRGNDYTFAVTNILAGALAAYSVRDIKNRSQIFRSFLFILLGYGLSVFAFGLERFASTETLISDFAFVVTNALISPVFTYGLLIFFEKFFNITTDLTLLELSNFDRPLLKELARKAPGTFNHSMTMGTLAETAAEKINANPLLARVGAYYHDIGKTLIPENFVENQLNNKNIHENLSPEESVSLIIEHVIDGMDLARKYKIPEEIIDFIPMHHGTTVISFFYEKAKKLYGDEKVNIKQYQYPGPKPNSKETAIVMLADSCESAVRSIESPDSIKVENVITNIINTRIAEGQLDETPITFSEINKIKEAFTSILMGQHHKRIRYPKQEELEKGVDETRTET